MADPMNGQHPGATRTVALALGSNLGSREEFLAQARNRLEARLGPFTSVSRIYETEPVGPPGQGRYLNQVVLLRSGAHPDALIETVQGIEAELGRTRDVPWGPRTIDVDLLLCDGEIWETGLATVPHPGLPGRAFVLAPLAELLPGWVHPRTGATVTEMLAACDATGVRGWDGARATGPAAGPGAG
jgi:2-amino-4-hydroxy-6-hydroxymethyldihydropteridine diphosphokinase